MVIRSGRRGEFLACSKYPECREARSFKRDPDNRIVMIEKAPAVTTDEKCDKCGAPMLVKQSRRGPFLACSSYPKCKNAKPLSAELRSKMPARPAPVATDIKCDQCGAPMLRRQGRFGEFLGCSAYPKCKNIQKVAPTPA
jgi:DNA topoisomerase-1